MIYFWSETGWEVVCTKLNRSRHKVCSPGVKRLDHGHVRVEGVVEVDGVVGSQDEVGDVGRVELVAGGVAEEEPVRLELRLRVGDKEVVRSDQVVDGVIHLPVHELCPLVYRYTSWTTQDVSNSIPMSKY